MSLKTEKLSQTDGFAENALCFGYFGGCFEAAPACSDAFCDLVIGSEVMPTGQFHELYLGVS